MSLIVTGSIGIDTIHTPTGQAPDVLGGSAIYFAAAASFYGPVRLVGAVGDDFPDELEKPFHHFDIDLAGLEKREGSKTFRWTGKYLDNMNDRETISVDLNVLAEDLPPVPAAFQDSQYLFLANTHPGGQLGLLEQFPAAKLVVADTMDLWIETEKDLLKTLLGKIDGLVLNDSEAQLLTGETNIVKAGEAILALGPKFVVIKKGEHGAFLLHADGAVALPAYPAKDVIDPTGAGDTFGGGMMGYLAASGGQTTLGNLKKAMAAGTVVASYNIESFSLGRLMDIGQPDLDLRLAEYAAMLDVRG
ncbi:MAG: PfkB family carbohydrate kinase [Planctomycetota bacterium]